MALIDEQIGWVYCQQPTYLWINQNISRQGSGLELHLGCQYINVPMFSPIQSFKKPISLECSTSVLRHSSAMLSDDSASSLHFLNIALSISKGMPKYTWKDIFFRTVEQLSSGQLTNRSRRTGYLSSKRDTSSAILTPTSQDRAPRQARSKLSIFFKLYSTPAQINLLLRSCSKKAIPVSFGQDCPKYFKKKGKRLLISPSILKLGAGIGLAAMMLVIFRKYSNCYLVRREKGSSLITLNSWRRSFYYFSPLSASEERLCKWMFLLVDGILPLMQIHVPLTLGGEGLQLSNNYSYWSSNSCGDVTLSLSFARDSL